MARSLFILRQIGQVTGMPDTLRHDEARRISERLKRIALPDSRFDLDLSKFIPGFADAPATGRWLQDLPSFRESTTIFLTLEASLWPARQMCLAAGKRVVMPTYGLRRGLFLLSPDKLTASQFAFATCLDGLEMLGEPLAAPRPDLDAARLFVSGASAVTTSGVRFGMGAGYIDCEWWIARHLGLVDEQTVTATIVHDCQVSDCQFASGPNELVSDIVLTPTRRIDSGDRHRPSHPPTLDFDVELRALPLVDAAITQSGTPATEF